MTNLLLVGLGGSLGSISRYFIATLTQKSIFGTFIANLSGAIILAYALHFYRIEIISEPLWLFIGIGFSGAFTTFSTFGHETLQLVLAAKYKTAIIYVSSSLALALGAVFIILNLLS